MAEGACRIQLCIPAMHDTFQFGVIVPASYDEYTALVKSGMLQANTSTDEECDRNVRFEIVGRSGTNVQEL